MQSLRLASWQRVQELATRRLCVHSVAWPHLSRSHCIQSCCVCLPALASCRGDCGSIRKIGSASDAARIHVVRSDAACAVNLILGNMFGSSLDPPLNPASGQAVGFEQDEVIVDALLVRTASIPSTLTDRSAQRSWVRQIGATAHEVDTIFYMALPCALFLMPASILLLHPDSNLRRQDMLLAY